MHTLDVSMCREALMKTFINHGGVDLLKAIIHEGNGDPGPGSNEECNSIPWCICGRCKRMPLEAENVCCRQRHCVTREEFFRSAVLDMSVLSIAIVNRSDVFADDPEYTPSSYRKAAYRQWILWQHGYLGRANRRVIPSCVVWAVRGSYPAPDGNYLGFKEY